ncbi:MAG: SpoIIE family protein phosphatase [Crocinitomicaceae bacterium]|nr:SpoIIE family protein phosphatase [Crocinitomicaceae bacterium]
MKVKNKQHIEALLIYLLLGVILIALVTIYFRLDKSIDETSNEILEEKSRLVHRELDNYFAPVEDKLQEEWFRLYRGEFNQINQDNLVKHFFSTIQSNPLISGCFISDIHGNHIYAAELREGVWFSTLIYNIGEPRTESMFWTVEGRDIRVKNENVKPTISYDPRDQQWFDNSMKSDTIVWTPPYNFQMGSVAGITVSKKLKSKDTVVQVISFDVTLSDLSSRTTHIKVGDNGYAFVFSKEGNMVGLPNVYSDQLQSLKKDSLINIKNSEFPELKLAFETFQKENLNPRNYEIESDGEIYIVNFSEYKLNGITFYTGTLIPRKDIVKSMASTKNFLIYAMGFILLVIMIIAHVYRRRNILHGQLQVEKANVDLQHKIVEEKNREIIDSINYAKRIQRAILPPEKQLNQVLRNGFIFYQPKDIVAGDFYWMEVLSKSIEQEQEQEQEQESILLAACDCTGHGVPGAMVSVICNNSLNRSVREFGLRDPGEILDKTRDIVIQEFEKSEDEVKDGMDVALVSLEQQQEGDDSLARNSCSKLKYAGANNPLWIIRKGASDVEVIKADKQPIGKFINPISYQTTEVELSNGDTFYIFSDGFSDQFGGDKGKKMKAANMKKLLLSIQDLDMDTQKQKLESFFEEWKGQFEQVDDVLVIGYRF